MRDREIEEGRKGKAENRKRKVVRERGQTHDTEIRELKETESPPELRRKN